MKVMMLESVLRDFMGAPAPVCPEGGHPEAGWRIIVHANDRSAHTELEESFPYLREDVLEQLYEASYICQPTTCVYKCVCWFVGGIKDKILSL